MMVKFFECFTWQNKEVKTIVTQNIFEMILTQKQIPIKNKRLITTLLDIFEEASHPNPKILCSSDNGAPQPLSPTVGEAWDIGGWDYAKPIEWDAS